MSKRHRSGGDAAVFSNACCHVLSWMLDVSDIQCFTSTSKANSALRPVFRSALHAPLRRMAVLAMRVSIFHTGRREGAQDRDGTLLLARFHGVQPCYRCAIGTCPRLTGLVCLECEYKTPRSLRSRPVIPDNHVAASVALKRLVCKDEITAALTVKQATFMMAGIREEGKGADLVPMIIEHMPLLTAEATMACMKVVTLIDPRLTYRNTRRAALALFLWVTDVERLGEFGHVWHDYDLQHRNHKYFDVAFTGLEGYLARAPTGPAFLKFWTDKAERAKMVTTALCRI